jgi:hypothetical protein
MKLDFLNRFVTARRLLRTLDRLATAQEQQVALLARIADRVAPTPLPEASKTDLLTTGPSYGRDADFVRIEEFIERCEKDLKRPPTEDEIVDFLEGRELRI